MSLSTVRSAFARAAALAFCFFAAAAAVQLRVEVTGVGSNQFPIAVAAFARDGQVPQDVDGIIRANLARSGVFRLIDAGSTPVPETARVDLADWKARGADAVVVAACRRALRHPLPPLRRGQAATDRRSVVR
jgi:TolB protein